MQFRVLQTVQVPLFDLDTSPELCTCNVQVLTITGTSA